MSLTAMKQISNENMQHSNRERVNHLLEDAVKNPLVVLTADSGTGKTTAVRSFVSKSKEHVVWVHLTPMDSNADRFWPLFIKTVAGWNEELAHELSQVPFPDSLPSVHRFLHMFENTVNQGKKVILVLDNFHLLRDGPVKSLIVNLIEAGIKNISFILISGEGLNITLSDRVQPVRLTNKHLQFTREEIRVYYTALGIVLDPKLLDTICGLTDGWAAMVYMLGIHLQRDEPLTQSGIDSAITYLFYMFEEDIFLPLTLQAQQSLILLSLLNEFPLELAEDLTDLGNSDLVAIFQSIPFIRFHPSSSSYFFHQLFRQFLETKHSQMSKKIRNAFLRKAAAWYEKRGKLVEPFTYYLACNDYGRVLLLLDNYNITGMKYDKHQVLSELIDKIPTDYLQEHPLLWFFKVFIHISAGYMEKGLESLRLLRGALKTIPDSPEKKKALGELNVLVGLLNMRDGNFDFVGQFKAASEFLPDGSFWKREKVYFVGSGRALPFNNSRPGDLLDMKEALFQCAPYTQKLFGNWGRGYEYLAAAEAHYYRGEFPQALSYAGETITTSVKYKQWDIACNACYILVRASVVTGNLQEAEYNLKLLRQYAEFCTKDYLLVPDIAEFMLYYHVDLEENYADWIKEDTNLQLGGDRPDAGRDLYVKALYLVTVNKYYPALVYIDNALAICTETGQWFSKFNLHILKAAIYDLLNQYAIAAKQLQIVYEMSYPNHIIMPVAEYGSFMLDLIRHLKEVPSGTYSIPQRWLDLVQEESAKFARAKTRLVKDYFHKYPQVKTALESLTKREHETLILLCQGLSNEEIATKMGIEVNSVKTSLTRVYRKIGASNRGDAVRIGLSSNLLKI